MPSGEGQQGKRRGAYGRRIPQEISEKWSRADKGLFRALVAQSHLEYAVAAEVLATGVVQLSRQARELDAIPARTGDQERALTAARDKIARGLSDLKLLGEAPEVLPEL